MKALEARCLRILDETKVAIIAELGEVSLSLSELLDLAPGCRIDIPLDDDRPIVLSLAGTPVARSRAVEENGEIFLEVTEVLPGPETSE
jgi:flagellar motor switch protein FliM